MSNSGGPHPTMIGNVLDPAVKADAQKGGRGVGGTSESTIKDEAREHIGSGSSGQGAGSSGFGSGSSGIGSGSTGLGSGSSGIGSGSTGLGSGSSGIGSGSTGLGSGSSGLGSGSTGLGSNTSGYGGQSYDTSSTSGRSGFNEPSATETHNQGIDHIKRSAGLDSESGRSTGLDSNSGVTSGVRQSETGYGSSNTGSSVNTPSSTTGMGSDARTRDTETHSRADTTGSGSQLRQGTAAGGDDIGTTRGEGATSGSTGTSGNTSTSGSTSTTGGSHSTKGADPADTSDSRGGPPPSIPTAGGERIGTKHWGESKIIPEVPPRRESASEGGVSSSAGQPDAATKSNTDRNTGGATKPGSTTHDDTAKESVVDKLKDKLGMGHK